MSNGVSPEEIERAREIDLLSFLKKHRPYELVRISRGNYCTKTHDSLKISNGKWMWFSRGIGGVSALDYLIKVEGKKLPEAVREINGESILRVKNKGIQRKKVPIFALETPVFKRVPDYLLQRKISKKVIDFCRENKMIYESEPYHNAVFVGFDNDGVRRYGAYRSCDDKKILGEVAGSDKRWAFRITNPECKEVHSFESAIDLLSYATLLLESGKDFRKYNLLSLGGVYSTQSSKIPVALQNFLDLNPSVNCIYLHLDNDEAGRNATKLLIEKLSTKYTVIDKAPPAGKDVNDFLCIKEKRKEEYER